jgi:hypothetical protein
MEFLYARESPQSNYRQSGLQPLVMKRFCLPSTMYAHISVSAPGGSSFFVGDFLQLATERPPFWNLSFERLLQVCKDIPPATGFNHARFTAP